MSSFKLNLYRIIAGGLYKWRAACVDCLISQMTIYSIHQYATQRSLVSYQSYLSSRIMSNHFSWLSLLVYGRSDVEKPPGKRSARRSDVMSPAAVPCGCNPSDARSDELLVAVGQSAGRSERSRRPALQWNFYELVDHLIILINSYWHLICSDLCFIVVVKR